MPAVRVGATIAVTGASGFVGSAMVRQLAGAGYRVVGISERPHPPQGIRGALNSYVSADLTTTWPATERVDAIVHLAGLAAVGPSFDQPQRYIDSNSSMVTNLFEHILDSAWHGRVVVVSSGAVYGTQKTRVPLSEVAECAPTSPYVVSKMLVENQTEYYRGLGVDAVVARPFNHIGPGQLPGFIVPDLTAAVLRSEPGEAITVGNLDTERDYTDVRDVARAYRLLLEHPRLEHGVYNVCSGTTLTGWEVLGAICRALGRDVPAVTMDAERATDASFAVGSAERLTRETGWAPTISAQQSIADFVHDQQLFDAGMPENR
jgi:GDP-4-dehydro-6-deoxy-D-mannose reductase